MGGCVCTYAVQAVGWRGLAAFLWTSFEELDDFIFGLYLKQNNDAAAMAHAGGDRNRDAI